MSVPEPEKVSNLQLGDIVSIDNAIFVFVNPRPGYRFIPLEEDAVHYFISDQHINRYIQKKVTFKKRVMTSEAIENANTEITIDDYGRTNIKKVFSYKFMNSHSGGYESYVNAINYRVTKIAYYPIDGIVGRELQDFYRQFTVDDMQYGDIQRVIPFQNYLSSREKSILIKKISLNTIENSII